ncbi:FAD-binding protein [Streptomyces abyssomicinicus]|uniref:FAD-binding protein n=1 Tax=Streptomyces abyssomicinicus TaxID=574929 RepID=UPI00124FFDCF|nr:FAD-binding protein [Streptomyces abyssomicinicus]
MNHHENLGRAVSQTLPSAWPRGAIRVWARVRIVPGSFGTFAGLATDEHARVLGDGDELVLGLYAVGDDQASVMGGHYPAGGINLGPAMTFGWIAARHLAGPRQPPLNHGSRPARRRPVAPHTPAAPSLSRPPTRIAKEFA